MGSLKMNKVTMAKYIKCEKTLGSTNIRSLLEEEEAIKETENKKSDM